jgi:hypothetical protein
MEIKYSTNLITLDLERGVLNNTAYVEYWEILRVAHVIRSIAMKALRILDVGTIDGGKG